MRWHFARFCSDHCGANPPRLQSNDGLELVDQGPQRQCEYKLRLAIRNICDNIATCHGLIIGDNITANVTMIVFWLAIIARVRTTLHVTVTSQGNPITQCCERLGPRALGRRREGDPIIVARAEYVRDFRG